MIIKVKKILEQKDVKFANGKLVKKTQFMTDNNEVMDTFALIQNDEEYEGEVIENSFGKLFKKLPKINKQTPLKSDPDTMLIAYAEHIISSFIEAGVIKEPKDAARQLSNFSEVFFRIYDSRKNTNKNVINSDEAPF